MEALRPLLYGVWGLGEDILTLSLAPGKRVYGEKVLRIEGKEYRVWNPYRSKLGAAIKNGLKTWAFRKGINILYLGVAEGTTASHIADVVREGIIIGVDIAPRVMPKLMEVSQWWNIILPVLADAGKPEEYKDVVEEVGRIDIIYQDIAHPDQTKILLKNVEQFLEKGFVYYAIKARSIDVTKSPATVFREEIKKLERDGIDVIEKIPLEPYEKDHLMVVGQV